ncbi:tyrosine-type recombinase/integrase [Sphingomonas carotinifaciens]|uniref:tyrosine-type recombinase/integrase n=1 Tax=Sphingomonas carotinifaciens TaxID=1166323 RepID=UPI001840D5EA|nr:site-specific integrase [Sphingomonas carotinifaciens]MBB4085105.1 integrase [Sphingomonas carotinifaciens]
MTKSGIKALLPGGTIREHGITVTRTPTGDVRYSVNVMVDGQRIHRVIGKESEGVTRLQVEQAIEAFRTKAREGRLDLPMGRKSHPTFAELAPAYIQRLDETGGKNMKAKRQHVDQLLVPFFGSYRADRITTALVQDYTSMRLALGFKQATVNRELATLSHLMRRMAKWQWIKPESLPDIEKGQEPRKPIVILSDANIQALMKAAIADHDPHLWLFVAFGLNTAMRHSEILRVRYENIDYETRRIFIPEAKAGEREQPITPALVAFLKRQQQADGDGAVWLFPSGRSLAKQPHRISMAKPFQRAVIRAGLLPDKVTPHVMRHTAITRLVKAGVDLPTVQRISGHKTLAMVLRYVHIHGQHIDTAISAIDNAFPDLITPELHALSPRGAALAATIA